MQARSARCCERCHHRDYDSACEASRRQLRALSASIDHSIVAMTFNSIAIGVGRQLISIVVRVGFGLPEPGGPAKYSAYSLLYFAKSSLMFVRSTSTSTIFSHLLPASSST